MITIDIDTEDFSRGLSEFAQDQMPFAFSRALNAATYGVRQHVNQQLKDNFTIAPSRMSFLEGRTHTKGPDRATRNQLWARVGIYDQGRMGRGLLSRHTEDYTRTADPSKPFFIPTETLRPHEYALVDRANYPRRLKPIDRTEGTGTPYATPGNARKRRGRKAAPRPFVLDLPKSGPGVKGIFYRYGRERRQIKLLWLYVPEIEVKQRLHWQDAVASQVAALPEHLREGFAYAFRTSKVRRPRGSVHGRAGA